MKPTSWGFRPDPSAAREDCTEARGSSDSWQRSAQQKDLPPPTPGLFQAAQLSALTIPPGGRVAEVRDGSPATLHLWLSLILLGFSGIPRGRAAVREQASLRRP